MRGTDVDAARGAFTSRIIALGRAHDILTQTSWAGASITELVERALAAHLIGTGRIRVSGPELQLLPKPALALALAIHELATNAAKYGALSNDAGHVEVAWSFETGDGDSTFVFKWSEIGGPPVPDRQPVRKGFGSRLIEGVLAHDFAGTVTINFEPTGLICVLRSPLERLISGAACR